MSDPARGSLGHRACLYQWERFPLALYAPLVATFVFASAAYSRVLRGEAGFVSPVVYAIGAVTTLAVFLWLRILDEHKDAATDALCRRELPVPRGLISLGELRRIGFLAGGMCLLANLLVAPHLLPALGSVALLMALSAREFFVPGWLHGRPLATMLSHMLIMPAMDAYTTGLDWLAGGGPPHPALGLFLALSYTNGCVLEIGRKLRAPADEREGVTTYSGVWGPDRASRAWQGTLLAAGGLLVGCVAALGSALGWSVLLPAAGGAILLGALLPCAERYRGSPSPRHAARIEKASGLWVLGSYLLLGVLPFLARAAAGG